MAVYHPSYTKFYLLNYSFISLRAIIILVFIDFMTVPIDFTWLIHLLGWHISEISFMISSFLLICSYIFLVSMSFTFFKKSFRLRSEEQHINVLNFCKALVELCMGAEFGFHHANKKKKSRLRFLIGYPVKRAWKGLTFF